MIHAVKRDSVSGRLIIVDGCCLVCGGWLYLGILMLLESHFFGFS
jgi:hypothetical protein